MYNSKATATLHAGIVHPQSITTAPRRVTVDRHHQFLTALSAAKQDEDDLIDDLTVVDPYEVHAPGRRSDREVSKLLTLLDNLESGKAVTQ